MRQGMVIGLLVASILVAVWLPSCQSLLPMDQKFMVQYLQELDKDLMLEFARSNNFDKMMESIQLSLGRVSEENYQKAATYRALIDLSNISRDNYYHDSCKNAEILIEYLDHGLDDSKRISKNEPMSLVGQLIRYYAIKAMESCNLFPIVDNRYAAIKYVFGKAVYDHINNHLISKLRSNESPVANMDVLGKWMKSLKSDGILKDSLGHLLELSKFSNYNNIKCDEREYNLLKANELAASDFDVLDKKRRINRLIEHYKREHACVCRQMNLNRYEKLASSMDPDELKTFAAVTAQFFALNDIPLELEHPVTSYESLKSKLILDSNLRAIKKVVPSEVSIDWYPDKRAAMMSIVQTIVGASVTPSDQSDVMTQMGEYILKPCARIHQKLGKILELVWYDNLSLNKRFNFVIESSGKFALSSQVSFNFGKIADRLCQLHLNRGYF